MAVSTTWTEICRNALRQPSNKADRKSPLLRGVQPDGPQAMMRRILAGDPPAGIVPVTEPANIGLSTGVGSFRRGNDRMAFFSSGSAALWADAAMALCTA